MSESLKIFWISLLGLFLELLLIRWVGTEVRIFAYLQNTVLVVCFLGLGAGCVSHHRPASPTRMLGALALLTALLSLPPSRAIFAGISSLLSVLGDLNIWYAGISDRPLTTILSVGLGLGLTLIVMLLLLEVFVPVGRILGSAIHGHPSALRAYSLNVAGSLLGTWLFVLLSTLFLPPWVWFGAAALLALPLLGSGRQRLWRGALLVAPALCCAGGLLGDAALTTVWSPYQKLVVRAASPGGTSSGRVIEVNNAGYQVMLDLSETARSAGQQRFDPAQSGWSQYDLPTRLHSDPQEVLIVGAGSGNDVAGALRAGAARITAVEIDPAILEIGTRMHPERPYDSARVELVIDDARSFFSKARREYDVISFGLLDAHTTASMTNARLDHFVYTLESLRQVRGLLAPDGLLTLCFEARRPFIADRMARTLTQVFGHPPEAFRIPRNEYGWGGVMFVTGDPQAVKAALDRHPDLRRLIHHWRMESALDLSQETEPASDDWPFIYLSHRRVPLLFVLLAGLLLLQLPYLRSRQQVREGLDPRRWEREQWHFALLGAGFLLFEVLNISRAGVVLGQTWVVNAVIISAVLVLVLLANLLVARGWMVSTTAAFLALAGSLIALYLFDLSWLGGWPSPFRALTVGLVTTLPLLFSGVLFARAFLEARDRGRALGANLLGALVGAILQSLSFLTGFRSLLLLVLALYVAAYLTTPPGKQQRAVRQ